MSVRVLSWVWDHGPSDQGELLVLLALADFCDDTGQCWPSMDTIAKKARIQERSARRIVRRLEDGGWLSVDAGGGRAGSNRYTVKLGPTVPRTESPPRTLSAETRTLKPETRTHGSPKPSRTVNEPSESKDAVRDVLCAWASPEAAASFIAYRKRHKSKALTLTGAKRLATHLQEIFNAGFDPSDALGMAEEKGWASVEPNWYFRAKGYANVKQPTQRDARPDAALEQIARLAGLGATPGNGRG